MEFLDQSKLFLFVIFIIPGFISLKIYEILMPAVKKESSKLVIDAIAYSCINYGVWGLPLLLSILNKAPITPNWALYTYLFFLIIISPIINPIGILLIRKCKFIAEKLPHPIGRPWDYFFSLKQDCWVVVTLKDGSKIGGAYKWPAFASSAPEPEQLYLSEHWVLNDEGGFERRRTDTLGILILSSDIVTIELFKME